MAGALIDFIQGATNPPAGQALQGVTATLVTSSNADNTNVTQWLWEMIDKPPASAVPTGTMSVASTATFTPDVVGSYLLRLTTTDIQGVVRVDVRAVCVPESATYNRIIPPFGAEANAVNVNGQTRGWAFFIEPYLKLIERLRDVGGSPPANGEVLAWVAANNRYEPTAAAGGGLNQLTGDVLAGPGTGSQVATVVKVNGSTVPAGGALTTGNVLQASGAAALIYAAINLAGGAGFVTGVLPTANQAAQTVGGDLSGTTTTATVARVNGATIPAAGALVTGNVPQVNGVSSLTYAPINLAGGANFITGTLPTSNQASQTMGGNVTGTTASNIVVTLTGTSNTVTIPATTHLDFGAAPASVGFLRFSNNTSQCWRNAANNGDVVGLTVDNSNIVIVGSGGQTNTARLTCTTGTNVLEWETAATGINGRNAGNLWFSHTGAGVTTISSLSNQTMNINASQGVFNFGGAGTMTWNVNGTSGFNIVVSQSSTSPTWTQAAATAAGTSTVFRAQGAGGANNSGGRWTIQGGARTGTGLKGPVSLGINGTTETMVEIVEIAAGRRAVVLNRFADATTTQLPANSGDGIVYVGDAATAPTADVVTGCTIYSNTSVFCFRNGAANGGNRIDWTAVSAATATGGGVTPPAQIQEYITITYNGNVRKIPVYAN